MKAICLLLPFLVAPLLAAEPTPKPNLVIILSDDAGYNEFSLTGSKTIRTPRIDSIAEHGVRFTDGYVSGSVCSPSRAGLLAGRYQEHFGHEFNVPPGYSETNGLPLTETLLPAALKPAGYRTIALGKWHLGYAPKFHPMERGFSDYYGFLQGQRSYFPLAKPSRLNQFLRDREPITPENFTYMTDELAKGACDYIVKSKDQPFFLYLAFNATHAPMDCTKEDLAAAGGNKIKAMTMALDRGVGTVLDCLKDNGLTDKTLVVFLNDNGGATGHDNTPLHGHKGSSWDGGIRVPFAMQWPGVIPAGQTYRHPVISLDLFATFIATAGIEKSPGKPLDGVNLIPFLTGKNPGRPHQTLYWKHGPAWSVRDGDLKLVGGNTDQPSGQPGLFDLSTDISESKDLATSRPEEVKRLHALYDTWAAQVQPTPWGRGLKDEKDDEDPAITEPADAKPAEPQKTRKEKKAEKAALKAAKQEEQKSDKPPVESK
ncbi:MAG: sulfatase-like hydrolase/transferase [Luteolibacter sp.]